jgi:hypothetical protein
VDEPVADVGCRQGLDRLELIRFLQVAQTLSVHHAALAYLLGINALRASEAAAVRIEDYVIGVRMADPLFVALAVAFFALTALIVRGVDRL